MHGKKKEKLTVVYSNKLNDYNMSFLGVQMKRILLMCFALAHKQPDATVILDKTILNVLASSHHYTDNEVRELFKEFYEKTFDMSLESVRDHLAEKIHIFDSVTLNNNAVEITISVDKKVLKYISDVLDNFTAFNLDEFCQIQSPLGQELYRQMKQWKSRGITPALDIEELKIFSGMSPSTKIDKFKGRIENNLKAFEKLGMFENVKCKYNTEPGSKKIVSLEISFTPQISKMTKNTGCMITEEEIEVLMQKYGKEDVRRQMDRIRKHPEWKINGKTLDKWLSEKKSSKGDFCNIEQHPYDFELLEQDVLDKAYRSVNE